MNRKLILKSPRFVTFSANLAQLETKSDIPTRDDRNWLNFRFYPSIYFQLMMVDCLYVLFYCVDVEEIDVLLECSRQGEKLFGSFSLQ